MPNYALTPNDAPQDAAFRPCVGHKKNLHTLTRAIKSGNFCLMEVTIVATGERVAALCATQYDSKTKEVQMVPFAVLPNGNPYELLKPCEGLTPAAPIETKKKDEA